MAARSDRARQALASDRRRQVGWFVALTFAVSWPLMSVPLLFGEPGTSAHTRAALVAWSGVMLVPALAALLVTWRTRGAPIERLGLASLGERRAYVWAWLLFPVLGVATALATILLGFGRLDLGLATFREALAGTPFAGFEPFWLVVATQIGAALTINVLVDLPLTLGEETGWRGFLLERLEPMGAWPALLTTGVVWGAWHAPVILQGHNFPGHPYLGVPLMIATTTLAGVLLGWLWFRTRSAWVAALGHASINGASGTPVIFLSGVDFAYGGILLSVSGGLVMLVFIAWLVWTGRLPRPFQDGPTGSEVTGGPGLARR